MSQYGYSGRENPFDDRTAENSGYRAPARGPPQAAFGAGPRPNDGGSRHMQGQDNYGDNFGSNNVEMSAFGRADPNAILNECREIDRGVDEIEQNLNQLRMLQDRSLNDADQSAGSATSRQLDALSAETMSMYRGLTDRVRQVKSSPESQQAKNAPQVSRIDRRLKQAIQSYQQVESSFRKKTQDQMARQYRIVRPDADESEVRAAVEDTSQGAQVFQQALMQSGRQGQARAVLNAVQDRHAALQKIEQQMVELAQLFQDMDTLVVQQETMVANIEQKAEEVVENLDKGNEEIAVAVTTARKTRKKKWICLGIVVAIVIVIAAVIVVYLKVTQGGNKNNSQNAAAAADTSASPASPPAARSINDELRMNNVGARSLIEVKDPPIPRIYLESRFVIPGKDYKDDTPSAPSTRGSTSGRAKQLSNEAKRYVEWDSSALDTSGKSRGKRWVVPNAEYKPDGASAPPP